MKTPIVAVTAAALLLTAACRLPSPKPASVEDAQPDTVQASPPSPDKQQISRAEALMEQGRFDDAQATLAPILTQANPPAEATQLATLINEKRVQKALEDGQEAFRTRALREVEQRMLMPETYGETVVISKAQDEPLRVPSGPMEKMITRPVTLQLQSAGVKDIVLALSQIDNLNVIADQALSSDQKLTVDVTGVPLKEVLQYIARNMNIDFHLGRNVVWVTQASAPVAATPQLETQIYALQRGFIPALSSDKKGKKPDGLNVPSEDDTELENALETFFSDGPEGAAYRVYRDRNLLIVRNTRTNIRKIEHLLQRLDRSPRQVLIEARFVTISQNDLTSLGFTLNDLVVPSSGDKASFSDLKEQEKKVTIKKDNKGNVKEIVEETVVAMPEALAERRLRSVGALPGQLTISGILGNVTYQAILNALKQMSDSRTLSAPRLTVANNRTAAIHRGEKRYYFEEYDLQSIDQGDFGIRTQLVPVGSPKELDLGYKLNVRVNVGNDGETLMLALKPEITEFLDWDQLFGEDVRLPRVATNTLHTTVVVQSGETVVLGGTLTKSQTKSTKRIPVLSDMPGIGQLFRTREDNDQPQHLLIFVTARVVDGKGRFVEVR